MTEKIIKRNGDIVDFNSEKIKNAVEKALKETDVDGVPVEPDIIASLITDKVVERLDNGKVKTPSVEEIQDLVENTLIDMGYRKTAKAYMIYRAEHARERSRKETMMDMFMNTFDDITLNGHESKVTKGSSGNANIDSDAPMGKMLQFGSESSKSYAVERLIEPRFAKAHKDGDIHIHDLDFVPMKTLTCCQIDLEKLFEGGFSTGHGFLRKPTSIGSYGALTAIAFQANQNEQHSFKR